MSESGARATTSRPSRKRDDPTGIRASRVGLAPHLPEHWGDYSPGSTTQVWMEGIEESHREIKSKSYGNLRAGIETTFYRTRCLQVIDPFGNWDEPRMSYGIMPFAVRLAEVGRAFGSGDAALLARITKAFDAELECDAWGTDDESEPTLEEALHEVIEGRPFREGHGGKYGYVVELLCDHFGKSLLNSEFMPFHHSWPERVDRGLAQAGVPEEVLGLRRHLMYRGSPVAIPDPPDWPVIGYLKADEIGPALRALGAADLGVLDPEVRDSVGQLRGWLEACAASACDLVCFYH